tara:strand:+ start:1686 stop:3530 length:1845 start_codon:yes stop_codon:yes gene_type:complete
MNNFLAVLSSDNKYKNEILNNKKKLKNQNKYIQKEFGDLLLISEKNLNFKFAVENNVYSFLFGTSFNEEEILKDYFSKNFDDKYLYIRLFNKFGYDKTLNLINGDFNLLLYDKKKNAFFINRDRFGIKQLYFSKVAKSLLFSNRCRTLIKFGVKSDPDPNFIGRYSGGHYRYIDNKPNNSAYKYINQLPASHALQVKKKNARGEYIKINRWWVPKIPKRLNSNFRQEVSSLSENYTSLILDSVKKRINKSSKTCFTLSGGMDSSTVLASSVKILGRKLPALTTTYDDKTYDESLDIKPMLKKNVSTWHKINISSKNIDEKIIETNSAHDEPVPTATWLSDFFLKKKIKQIGYKTCFNGLGGDQLNAGEHDYFHYYFADLKKDNKELLNYELIKWEKLHNHPIYKKNIEKELRYLNVIVDNKVSGKCLYDKNRLFKYEKYVKNNFFNKNFIPKIANPYKDFLRNKTYQDTFYELMPCCVRSDQINSNQFNIENQYPFLDYRLFEFMLNLSSNLKIKNGVTKFLLREATKDILPEETRNRVKKSGWNAPAHIWFNGKNSHLVDEILDSKSFYEKGIYNVKKVKKLYNEHKKIIKKKTRRKSYDVFLADGKFRPLAK